MKKRLFVAIDLPNHIRQRLEPLCCGLPGARWVAAEQMHLTLSFIGEVDGSVYYDIVEALAGIEFATFSMRLQGVGFFPPRKNPRVVWAGLAENEQVQLLHRKIYTSLSAIGLRLESRKFAPHITLARLKNTPPSRVGRYLENFSLFATESFVVDSFLLYSSVLGRKGARHFVEEKFFLQ